MKFSQIFAVLIFCAYSASAQTIPAKNIYQLSNIGGDSIVWDGPLKRDIGRVYSVQNPEKFWTVKMKAREGKIQIGRSEWQLGGIRDTFVCFPITSGNPSIAFNAPYKVPEKLAKEPVLEKIGGLEFSAGFSFGYPTGTGGMRILRVIGIEKTGNFGVVHAGYPVLGKKSPLSLNGGIGIINRSGDQWAAIFTSLQYRGKIDGHEWYGELSQHTAKGLTLLLPRFDVYPSGGKLGVGTKAEIPFGEYRHVVVSMHVSWKFQPTRAVF